MAAASRAGDAIAEARTRLQPKAKSLVVTVWGDAIEPHRGRIWLGSLIRLLAPFGLNERIVRTCVFRLAKEDWIAAQAIGRRSYYALTPAGEARVAAAHRRIYAPQPSPWDGAWTMVLGAMPQAPSDARERLRRELGWQGFGLLPGGTQLHPDPDPDAVRAAVRAAGLGADAVVLRAVADRSVDPAALAALTRSSWDLDRIAADYAAFLDSFRPVWRALEGDPAPDPALAFQARTLLIHGYRRALLRDPLLPAELLPTDWPGAAARLLCRNLYRLLQAPAQQHVVSVLETAEGPLADPVPAFSARFGGAGPAPESAGRGAI